MKAAKRVIVIDPATRTITESTVRCLEDMQQIVGGLIERALITDDGTNHELYVNEEGLFEEELHPFTFVGARQPILVGRAFLIGPVDRFGENQAATLSVQEVAAMVGFPEMIPLDNPSMADAPDSSWSDE